MLLTAVVVMKSMERKEIVMERPNFGIPGNLAGLIARP